jgi:tetratricopeptide (TPR) repeat protein
MRYLTTFLAILISCLTQAQELQVGIDQFDNKKYDLANNFFNAINSGSTNYVEARYYLGRIAIENQEFDDARDYFSEAIKGNKNISKYHKYYGVALGNILVDSNQFRQAMLAPKMKNAFKRAVKLDPTDWESQKALVNFYSQAPGIFGGSWENAFEAADAIYEIDSIEGKMARANIYQRKGDIDLAEKGFIELVEIHAVCFYELGLLYQERKMFEKSFETFEKGLVADPENWRVLYQIGKNSALSGLGTKRGIECLNLYIEADRGNDLPSRSAAKARIGMIYEKQGNISKAKSQYQETLNEDPNQSLAKDGIKRIG